MAIYSLCRFGAGALLFFFCAATFAQNPVFDKSRMDASVEACDNFYQYANGAWLKNTEIPAAFPSWSGTDILATRNREISRDISKTLFGVTEQFPRWRRCVRATDNAVGEALGQVWVKKNFKPEARKRMNELIDNLFASYREHINQLDWMTDPTRQQA